MDLKTETNALNHNIYDRIASLIHTIIMIAILVSFSISGFMLNTSPNDTISGTYKFILYFSITVGKWALLYYMWIGIKKANTPVPFSTVIIFTKKFASYTLLLILS